MTESIWISGEDVASCLRVESPWPVESAQPLFQNCALPAVDPAGSLSDYRNHQEREYFVRLLQSSGGNVADAARAAKMSRQGLHKALGRLGLSASDFRKS